MPTTYFQNFIDYSWVGFQPAIVVFTTTNVFFIATTFLYYLRRNHEHIHRRRFEIVLINIVCTAIITNTFLLEIPVLQVGLFVPCMFNIIVYHFVVPLWIFTLFLRAGHLLLTYISAQARLELSIKGDILIYRRMNVFDRFMLRILLSVFGKKADAYTAGISSRIGIRQLMKAQLILTVMEVILFGFSLAIKFRMHPDPEICTDLAYMPIYAFVGAFLLLIPYAMYSIRQINDPFRIRQELTAMLIVITIGLLLYFSIPTTKIPATSAAIFLPVTGLLLHLIQVVFPLVISFLSDYRRNHLSLCRESFRRTLEDPVLFQEFKQVLARGFTIENALFVEEYLLLKNRTATLQDQLAPIVDVGETRQTETISINLGSGVFVAIPEKDEHQMLYNKFIKVDAPYELNIPYHLRAACEIALLPTQAESGSAVVSVFEDVYLEVCEMMYRNSFPRFVRRRQQDTEKGKVVPL
ncbi:hypothetical protein HK102_002492 [Quaeritorhiza haematococci]|nr:hypothetical protein HK102_002492 [Quaeritorhiza haematococci]